MVDIAPAAKKRGRPRKTVDPMADFIENCKDRRWRLNHLYRIVNKYGVEVVFQENYCQRLFWENLHDLNVILKARQLGYTTFICLIFLDLCVFNDNFRAGIIAHTLDDAKKIFRDKIVFPYEHLDPYILKGIKAVKSDGGELILSNGSSMRVGVSMRSATLDALLISEYGKICARYPEKMMEIKTGAMEAVHKHGIKIVESTAEGPVGDFAEICEKAQLDAAVGGKLAQGQYKFHFSPWYIDPEYEIDPDGVVISEQLTKYFNDLAGRGINLSDRQRAWYAIKRDGHNGLGEKMFREYPTTPEEAFWSSVEGSYYGEWIGRARAEGRIKPVPYDPSLLVHTFWDLGIDDSTTIWFAQFSSSEIRLIDYHESSNKGLEYYIRHIHNLPYVYGQHFAPHDIRVRELGSGISRKDTARKLGLVFKDLSPARIEDGIEAVKSILSRCWFDVTKCKVGLKALESYRHQWNEKLEKYDDAPLHDWASHAADAFRYLAMAYRYDYINNELHNPQLQAMFEEKEENYDPLGAYR